jgi:hypothetical protein
LKKSWLFPEITTSEKASLSGGNWLIIQARSFGMNHPSNSGKPQL